METRAGYAAVGGFVLILTVAFFAFIAWLTATSYEEGENVYLTYFTGSVTGLQAGSQVRLNGIPVGAVTELGFDEDDPQRIRARLELAPGTPILSGSVATLAQAGLTGGAFVEIQPGRGDQPIEAAPDAEFPVIPSAPPATIGAVVSSLPELLDEATLALRDLRGFLGPQNQQAITEILVSMQSIAEAVAENREAISETLARTNLVMTHVDELVVDTSVQMVTITDQVATLLAAAEAETTRLGDEIAATTAEFRGLSRSLDGAAGQLDLLVEETRPGLREFTNVGLQEVTLTLSELRLLAQSLSRLVVRLQQGDTPNLLFGDSDQGVVFD